jgi:hypothetical protein
MFEFIKKLQLLLEAKKPAGDYAALSLSATSTAAIKKWALNHNIEVDEEHDLHITTAYSKTPFEYDWTTLGVDLENVEAVPIKFDVFETTNSKTKLLVVLVDCPYASQRFSEYMDHGAEYDYDEYRPHITLSKEWSGDLPDISTLPKIMITSEYHSKLEE